MDDFNNKKGGNAKNDGKSEKGKNIPKTASKEIPLAPPTSTTTAPQQNEQAPVLSHPRAEAVLPSVNTNLSVPQQQHPDDTPSMAQFRSLIPPNALKTIRLQRPRRRSSDLNQLKPIGSSPDRPIAPKIIVLKKPPPFHEKPPPAEEPPPPLTYESRPFGSEDPPYPFILHDEQMLSKPPSDKTIDKKLTEMLNEHRDYVNRKLKRERKTQRPRYRFPEMVKALTDEGIPCPVNEDFARLQGQHSRWDPQGTVIEYFSPALKTFVPVNMRGRYRGCSTDENCVKGINISTISPKRDALEGFVDRARHNIIQQKYDDMSTVAIDEPHLDYLIEIQAYHSETLPIPIFYDMLHLGMEVENEHLQILVQEEGYPPNDPIFKSSQSHAEQLRRKIQLYGALGLEILESERKGLGEYVPQWLKSRDEIIRDIMRAKNEQRYRQLQRMEEEAELQGEVRRRETNVGGMNVSVIDAAAGDGDMEVRDSRKKNSVVNAFTATSTVMNVLRKFKVNNKVSPEEKHEDESVEPSTGVEESSETTD